MLQSNYHIHVAYKGGDYMTGREVINLTQKLKEKSMSAEEIVEIIEYIETHDPKELDA